MAVHLPSSHGRGRRRPMADINVTPLVDVMLVLLIIFMITAPMLTSGVSVKLPESRAKALEQDSEPVQIAIDEKGEVYVDSAMVGDRQLPTVLAGIASESGADGTPRQVYLRADQALGYGKVMRVMGELNRAGLNRVALVTTTDTKSATDTK